MLLFYNNNCRGLVLTVISLLVLSTAQVEAFNYCTPDGKMSVSTKPVANNSPNMTFVITSKVQGWCAIGLGQSMSDADIMMTFANGKRLTVVSAYSSQRQLPVPYEQQYAQMLTGSTANNGLYTFVFQRPIKADQPGMKNIQNGETSMIWAYSDAAIDGEFSTLGIHASKGVIRANLFSEQSVAAGPDATQLVLAHAAMMIVAWFVFVPAGIFIARFLKSALGVWWFRLHAILMSSAVIFVIIGLILIIVALKSSSGETLAEGAHPILGFFIIALMLVQSIWGVVIDRLFDPLRKYVPWHDQVHWWLGRVVFILAIANSIYGAVYYKLFDVLYACITLMLLAIIALVFGQVFIGQQHHVQDQYSGQRASDFLPNIESVSTYNSGSLDKRDSRRSTTRSGIYGQKGNSSFFGDNSYPVHGSQIYEGNQNDSYRESEHIQQYQDDE
ncbi:hypothetical protein MIR68_000496 [Amoeboaphelidium protococcarum]|nr:hypothetical protein MIR68_000496 [Amoeboaphelidium protococcarum]